MLFMNKGQLSTITFSPCMFEQVVERIMLFMLIQTSFSLITKD